MGINIYDVSNLVNQYINLLSQIKDKDYALAVSKDLTDRTAAIFSKAHSGKSQKDDIGRINDLIFDELEGVTGDNAVLLKKIKSDIKNLANKCLALEQESLAIKEDFAPRSKKHKPSDTLINSVSATDKRGFKRKETETEPTTRANTADRADVGRTEGVAEGEEAIKVLHANYEQYLDRTISKGEESQLLAGKPAGSWLIRPGTDGSTLCIKLADGRIIKWVISDPHLDLKATVLKWIPEFNLNQRILKTAAGSLSPTTAAVIQGSSGPVPVKQQGEEKKLEQVIQEPGLKKAKHELATTDTEEDVVLPSLLPSDLAAIAGAYASDPHDIINKLENFKPGEDIEFYKKMAQQVTKLNLRTYPGIITDISRILDFFENVKVLQMPTTIVNKDLEAVLLLKELRVLDLSGCTNITDTVIACLKEIPLQHLDLMGCTNLGAENLFNSLPANQKCKNFDEAKPIMNSDQSPDFMVWKSVSKPGCYAVWEKGDAKATSPRSPEEFVEFLQDIYAESLFNSLHPDHRCNNFREAMLSMHHDIVDFVVWKSQSEPGLYETLERGKAKGKPFSPKIFIKLMNLWGITLNKDISDSV